MYCSSLEMNVNKYTHTTGGKMSDNKQRVFQITFGNNQNHASVATIYIISLVL